MIPELKKGDRVHMVWPDNEDTYKTYSEAHGEANAYAVWAERIRAPYEKEGIEITILNFLSGIPAPAIVAKLPRKLAQKPPLTIERLHR